jgi:peptidoglycan hydrolase-like protein with peptidoglycan-binding domain
VGEEVFAMRRVYVVRAGMVLIASITLATTPMEMSFGQNTKPSKGVSASAARPEHVRELQEALAKSGYDPGPIDGIMGPRTKEALRKYMAVPPPKEPSPSDQVITRFRTERRESP